MADFEFRRIAQADEREPSAFGQLALALFVFTIFAIAIVRAAQVAEDVKATRARIDTIKPCRPEPATTTR